MADEEAKTPKSFSIGGFIDGAKAASFKGLKAVSKGLEAVGVVEDGDKLTTYTTSFMDDMQKQGRLLRRGSKDLMAGIPATPDKDFEDALASFRETKAGLDKLQNECEGHLRALDAFTSSAISMGNAFVGTKLCPEELKAGRSSFVEYMTSLSQTLSGLRTKIMEQSVQVTLTKKRQDAQKVEQMCMQRKAKKQEYDYYVDKVKQLEQKVAAAKTAQLQKLTSANQLEGKMEKHFGDLLDQVERNKEKRDDAQDSLEDATDAIYVAFHRFGSPLVVQDEFEAMRLCYLELFTTGSTNLKPMLLKPRKKDKLKVKSLKAKVAESQPRRHKVKGKKAPMLPAMRRQKKAKTPKAGTAVAAAARAAAVRREAEADGSPLLGSG